MKLTIPESPAQITWAQFDRWRSAFELAQKPHEEATPLELQQLQCAAMAAFWGVDAELLYTQPIKLIEGANARICNLCQMAEVIHSDEYQFEYKGETFTVSLQYIGGLLGANPSFIESVEVAALTEQRAELAKRGYYPDFIGEALNVGVVAVVAKAAGEKHLPLNDMKRIAFIASRIEHFADLPIQVVANVAFFLTTSIAQLSVSRVTSWGLKVSNIQRTKPRPRQRKAKKR